MTAHSVAKGCLIIAGLVFVAGFFLMFGLATSAYALGAVGALVVPLVVIGASLMLATVAFAVYWRTRRRH